MATSSVLELLEQFIRWASFVLHTSVILLVYFTSYDVS